MGKVIAIISFVIFLAAFLFCGVGYGAPWWWVDDILGISSYGLFQGCVKTDIEDDSWECGKLGTDLWSNKHKATVGMMTVGLAINLAAGVLYCKSMCGDKSVNAAAGASIGAGVFVLIAVVVFGSDNLVLDVDYLGWTFWVAAIGGAGHIANGIVTLILECISCC